MRGYTSACKELSLTAREAIALLVFEDYCNSHNIESILIDEFLSYLWQWPLINGPDEFEPWESKRPELVNYGLGDPASIQLIELLDASGIDESEFRDIISGIVEILWGSFWGKAEDEVSYNCLQNVLKAAKPTTLPPITPFKFSLFKDGSGWGVQITKTDRDFWRSCGKIT